MLLSLVVTYYKSPQSLRVQLDRLSKLSPQTRRLFEVVIVDDASPTGFDAFEVVKDFLETLNLRLFRVNEDITWNHRSARNIGFYEMSGEWGLALDIDTFPILESLFRNESSFRYAKRTFFLLHRVDEISKKPLGVHHDTYLIRKSDYWSIGGFDENLAGMWGFGKLWFRDAKKKLRSDLLWGARVERRQDLDSQTLKPRKKTFRSRVYVARIRFLQRIIGRPERQILTFDYERVL